MSNFLLDSKCLHSTTSDLMNWEVYVHKLLTWWMVPGLHELHMQWLPFSSSTELPGKSKSESRTRSEMQWDCPLSTTRMWDRQSLFGTCQHFVTLNPCTMLKAKREDKTTFPNFSHAIQLCRGRACPEGVMLFEHQRTIWPQVWPA